VVHEESNKVFEIILEQIALFLVTMVWTCREWNDGAKSVAVKPSP